ncbi:hypothetical protein GQ53DRAFT_660731, partial [Thozetella sp. PMI_491]
MLQCTHLTQLLRASQIRRALDSLPRELYSAYDKSMQRITEESQERRTLAMSALSWIYHSKRQMSTSELVHALGYSLNEPPSSYKDVVASRVVTDVCAGLVVLQADKNTFRYPHQSVYEYFNTVAETWFPSSRDDITKACLTCLS